MSRRRARRNPRRVLSRGRELDRHQDVAEFVPRMRSRATRKCEWCRVSCTNYRWAPLCVSCWEELGEPSLTEAKKLLRGRPVPERAPITEPREDDPW